MKTALGTALVIAGIVLSRGAHAQGAAGMAGEAGAAGAIGGAAGGGSGGAAGGGGAQGGAPNVTTGGIGGRSNTPREDGCTCRAARASNASPWLWIAALAGGTCRRRYRTARQA
jgi:hypothetical protein